MSNPEITPGLRIGIKAARLTAAALRDWLATKWAIADDNGPEVWDGNDLTLIEMAMEELDRLGRSTHSNER